MRPVALITGASGFLGRHVTRHFSAAGWSVVGLGLDAWPDYAAWGAEQWHQTPISLESLAMCSVQPDLVAHLASPSTVSGCVERPMEAFQGVVGTTATVLEYVRCKAPNALTILASSAAVYGVAEQVPTPEYAPLNPISAYGTYKKQAEELCALYSREFRLKTVALRMFSVYGEELRKQLLWEACRRVDAGATTFFGTGREVRDWIHGSDCASLMALLADKRNVLADFTAMNAATGVATDTQTVLEILLGAMNTPLLPRFDGQARPYDPQTYVGSIGSARALGWAPKVMVSEGLRRYAAWYRAQAEQGK